MRSRRWMLAAAVVVAGSLSFEAEVASAKVAVGDRAPDFEGRDFFNTPPVTFQSLRGRLVFVELFSTG
jgi:hypothetical protein